MAMFADALSNLYLRMHEINIKYTYSCHLYLLITIVIGLWKNTLPVFTYFHSNDKIIVTLKFTLTFLQFRGNVLFTDSDGPVS